MSMIVKRTIICVFVAMEDEHKFLQWKKEQHKTKLTDIESAEIENPVPFSLFLTHKKIMVTQLFLLQFLL